MFWNDYNRLRDKTRNSHIILFCSLKIRPWEVTIICFFDGKRFKVRLPMCTTNNRSHSTFCGWSVEQTLLTLLHPLRLLTIKICPNCYWHLQTFLLLKQEWKRLCSISFASNKSDACSSMLINKNEIRRKFVRVCVKFKVQTREENLSSEC